MSSVDVQIQHADHKGKHSVNYRSYVYMKEVQIVDKVRSIQRLLYGDAVFWVSSQNKEKNRSLPLDSKVIVGNIPKVGMTHTFCDICLNTNFSCCRMINVLDLTADQTLTEVLS